MSSKLENNTNQLSHTSLRGAPDKNISFFKAVNPLRNMHIQTRLILAFLVLSIIPLTVTSVLSYYKSSEAIKSKISLSTKETLIHVKKNIQTQMERYKSISDDIIVSPTVQQLEGYDQMTQERQNEIDICIDHDVLTRKIGTLKSIKDVVIITNNNKKIIVGDPYDAERNSFIESMKEPANQKTGQPMWLITNYKNQTNNIVLYRAIKNMDTANIIGYSVITLNERFFSDILKEDALTVNGTYKVFSDTFIVDSEGKIISNNNVKDIGKPYKSPTLIQNIRSLGNRTLESFQLNVDHMDSLVSFLKIDDIDWYIVNIIPLSYLNKETESIRNFNIILGIAFILIAILLSYTISKSISFPLQKILAAMKETKNGNLSVRVDDEGRDEIGMLGEGYNDMVSNIKELIDKVYVLQIKEREAELNALQAQMNPHFLYNTLDTIYWKSLGSGENEIGDMVFSLSRLFRLSLNRGKEITTVANEKELIEHYLMLQKIRFKEKLNYEIYLNENILSLTIPKLIIQPFVENAIIHGIEESGTAGTVKISGIMDDRFIYFTIEDNGIGMSQEAIDSLLKTQDESSADDPSKVPGGYAINNTNDRLRLIFNGNYALNFYSELGKGTRVEIKIPVFANKEHTEAKNV